MALSGAQNLPLFHNFTGIIKQKDLIWKKGEPVPCQDLGFCETFQLFSNEKETCKYKPL